VTILDAADHSDVGRADLLGDAERPRIAVVGRLSPEKGVDVFLEAAAILMKRGISFSALVAGDGPERAALGDLAAALALSDRVRFLGRVSDMGSLYSGIDLLVIPSRSEGLPSVLLEALAADVAVVATRVGAIPEVLASPLTGALVPPESPDQLADAIETALRSLDNPDARAARALAADAYSQESRANALMALYRDLVPGAA
jgi:glycosyltransferase involved in cell wall biosynthesis